MPHVGIALFKLLLWLCNSTSGYFLQMIFSKTWISEGAGKANVNSSSCKFSFNSTRRSGVNWCALIHQKCYLQLCKSCPSASLFVIFLEKSLNMEGNKIWLKTGWFSNVNKLDEFFVWQFQYKWDSDCMIYVLLFWHTLPSKFDGQTPREKKHQNILHVQMHRLIDFNRIYIN